MELNVGKEEGNLKKVCMDFGEEKPENLSVVLTFPDGNEEIFFFTHQETKADKGVYIGDFVSKKASKFIQEEDSGFCFYFESEQKGEFEVRIRTMSDGKSETIEEKFEL